MVWLLLIAGFVLWMASPIIAEFLEYLNLHVIYSYSDVAATAIETLLAELEAAVEYIPNNCNTCRYWHDGGCVAPLELFGGCDFGVRQAWKWRGPQKGDCIDDAGN